jgi:hypothetical protein
MWSRGYVDMCTLCHVRTTLKLGSTQTFLLFFQTRYSSTFFSFFSLQEENPHNQSMEEILKREKIKVFLNTFPALSTCLFFSFHQSSLLGSFILNPLLKKA